MEKKLTEVIRDAKTEAEKFNEENQRIQRLSRNNQRDMNGDNIDDSRLDFNADGFDDRFQNYDYDGDGIPACQDYDDFDYRY